jgi:hypothetical protein
MKRNLLTIVIFIICICVCICAYNSIRNYKAYISHNNNQYEYMDKYGPLESYSVTTIKIRRAVICKIDKTYYILPDSTMRAYTGNDSLFTSRKDVILLKNKYTQSCLYRNYNLYRHSYFSIMSAKEMESIITAKTVINCLTFYEFKRKPKYLILYIQQEKLESQTMKEQSYSYYKEYIPAIGIAYSKREYKRISKMSRT